MRAVRGTSPSTRLLVCEVVNGMIRPGSVRVCIGPNRSCVTVLTTTPACHSLGPGLFAPHRFGEVRSGSLRLKVGREAIVNVAVDGHVSISPDAAIAGTRCSWATIAILLVRYDPAAEQQRTNRRI